MDGVDLKFDDDAVDSIADKAIALKIGARGLRSVMEDIMLDVMFDIPSNENIETCIINKAAVEKTAAPLTIQSDKKTKKRKKTGTEES